MEGDKVSDKTRLQRTERERRVWGEEWEGRAIIVLIGKVLEDVSNDLKECVQEVGQKLICRQGVDRKMA
jgi:hypothetical protein